MELFILVFVLAGSALCFMAYSSEFQGKYHNGRIHKWLYINMALSLINCVFVFMREKLELSL